MHPSRSHLVLLAAPAVAASLIVLVLGAVGGDVWLIHVLAICSAYALAAAGRQLSRLTRAPFLAVIAILLTLVGIGVPLFRDAPGPERWAALGPLNLYMAPVLLPSLLVTCSVCVAKRGYFEWLAFASIIGASVLLAAQPDASQAVALLSASAVAFIRSRADTLASVGTLAFTSLAAAWAFSRPDPLEPVPHVEGVFALALGHSLFAGVATITSAIALVAGLFIYSFTGRRPWLSAVATYYAALFACSVAGITPAPLIGYGAGPLLGFGLMAAMSQWASSEVLSNNSFKPKPLRGSA